MKCIKCKGQLTVQQTINIYNDNYILRRRFCPVCRIVYQTKEEVIESYELEKAQSNLEIRAAHS